MGRPTTTNMVRRLSYLRVPTLKRMIKDNTPVSHPIHDTRESLERAALVRHIYDHHEFFSQAIVDSYILDQGRKAYAYGCGPPRPALDDGWEEGETLEDIVRDAKACHGLQPGDVVTWQDGVYADASGIAPDCTMTSSQGEEIRLFLRDPSAGRRRFGIVRAVQPQLGFCFLVEIRSFYYSSPLLLNGRCGAMAYSLDWDHGVAEEEPIPIQAARLAAFDLCAVYSTLRKAAGGEGG